MSRRVTYYGKSFASILTPDGIFGANLVEWWRPEELSGFTAGAPLSGDWVSQGSFGSNYNQANTVAQPTVVNTVYSGYKGVDFDGVLEFVTSDRPKDDYKFLSSGEGFQFLILRSDDQSNNGIVMSNMDLNASNRSGFLFQNHSSNEFRVRTSDDLGSTFNISINSGAGTYFESNLNLILYKNDIPSSGNTSPTSGELGINSGALSDQNTSTNSVANDDPDNGINLGRSVGSSNFFEGLVLEHGIVNIQPTPAQISNLITYLENKYGGTFPI